MKSVIRSVIWFACAGLVGMLPRAVAQEPAFAVATIRPSAEAVKFESDGKTVFLGDTLRMQDVTVATCLKLAYGVQDRQISGPEWVGSERYDITAKSDGAADQPQMKLMLRALLAERFHLSFHREQKEMKALVLTVAPGGAKLIKAKAPDAPPFRENSANGTVAKSMPIQEFADFIAGPLHMPVVNATGLTDKYDFAIDFNGYVPEPGKNMDAGRPDATGILKAVMHDQLGLDLQGRKVEVEVMVIDHVEKPSAN